MPGAGGVRSTLRDLLIFARAHLTPPDSELGKAIQLAGKKHPVSGAPQNLMGLGWLFMPNKTTHFHNGQTGGSHSMVLIGKPKSLVVVLLSNTGIMELDQLAIDTMQLLRGIEVKPRVFDKDNQVAVNVAPEVMQRYIGRYQVAPNVFFTVSVKDGKLMVGLTNQATVPVFAKSNTEWFYKTVPVRLKFQLDKAQECTSLQVTQNGRTVSANRIPTK